MNPNYIGSNKTEDELLQMLYDYATNVAFPTSRNLGITNNMPSSTTYRKFFGSLKDAIIKSGIKIPKERERYFERVSLSDEELLEDLKKETLTKIRNISFPIQNTSEFTFFTLMDSDINGNERIQSRSMYIRRFGGIVEAYKLINFDYYAINNLLIRKDMKLKFMEIYDILKYRPTSRDLDDFSSKKNKYYYSTGAYLYHFGSMANTYDVLGFEYVDNRNLSTEEGLDMIYNLYHKDGIVPTREIINEHEDFPSTSFYRNRGYSMTKLFEVCNIPIDLLKSPRYYTEQGTLCMSKYELRFATALENNNIPYEKEIMYKKLIPNFSKLYRFDFTVVDIYIEIFGITGREDYDKKVEEKIQLCKDNNIKLIALFPQDMKKLKDGKITIKQLLTYEKENQL